MAYSPQFGKTDTLASQLAAGANSATLSSGNFTNFTTDYLVIDYDVPAKREVILCNVTGTSVASITRAQAGTSDVTHSAGAKVGYNFVPGHYANGLGAIAENDAWTAHTATLGGFSGTPTQANAYIQLGKIVFMRVNISGTSNANTFTFTLPVAAKVEDYYEPGRAVDNGSVVSTIKFRTAAGSTTVTCLLNDSATGFTTSGTKAIQTHFFYEAN